MTKLSSWSDVLIPAIGVIPTDIALDIATVNRVSGRRFFVLDDDPTGSQAVHDVEVVTLVDREAIVRSLASPGSTCFVLTNSRSLSEQHASDLVLGLGELAGQIESRYGGRVELISRGDSTLRGHTVAEVGALQAARKKFSGTGYDGVLFAPAFFEADRVTVNNVHWARVGSDIVPVSETEYSLDRSFGYSSSDLSEFLVEVGRGRLAPDDVISVSLSDIRSGGPERVAEVLSTTHDGQYVVINALEYSDFDVVILGVHLAEDRGHSFLYRTGPSFVRSIAGIAPKPSLRSADIYGEVRPSGHGLIVVGSHVGKTTRQVETLRAREKIAEFTIDVEKLVGANAGLYVGQVAADARDALAREDVLIATSRRLIAASSPDEQLRISRQISAGVVAITERILEAGPAWIIAKGGITSHDTLVKAMRVLRARIIGQLFEGNVSVLLPIEVEDGGTTVPCAIFPGNVGDEDALAVAVDILRGSRS